MPVPIVTENICRRHQVQVHYVLRRGEASNDLPKPLVVSRSNLWRNGISLIFDVRLVMVTQYLANG